MKHTNGGACPRCAEMFEDAHEDLRYAFYRVQEQFPDVHAFTVYRGKEAQDKEVKEGRSFLKWPESKHNVLGPDKKPRSEAMDLFRLTDEGKAEFRMGFYVQIANFLEDEVLPIYWGGNFRKLVDGPHFELKTTAKG